MSHEIRYGTYPLNCNKAGVQADWDEVVGHEDYQEGASGLPSGIRWLDVTLPSYEEAKEYIEKHDRNWYDCLAVKYLDFSKVPPNKKVEELAAKVLTLTNRYREKMNEFHFANVKSEFIGCKTCGSKIARKHLRGNRCPVCSADMRPESTLNSIAAAKAAVEKAEANLAEEKRKYQKKCEDKAEVKWLVKVEFHT